MAPADRPLPLGSEMRFMADAMLERLAAWLRILGFDTALDRTLSDEALVQQAIQQQRVILTRDRRLTEEWRVSGLHFVAETAPLAQLREVSRRFDLAGHARPFTRCSRCNTVLDPASKRDVRAAVPPRAYASHSMFLRCPTCQRVYWPGAHTRRMRRTLRDTLARLGWPGE
ncbi:MAG: hypothetical protein HKM89_01880 [Gemmatimonadales bacterium]|nr:hypothetical protein [Gemmatimonadales bacterium]